MEEINRKNDRRERVALTVLAGEIRFAVERSWINERGYKVTSSRELGVSKKREVRRR